MDALSFEILDDRGTIDWSYDEDDMRAQFERYVNHEEDVAGGQRGDLKLVAVLAVHR